MTFFRTYTNLTKPASAPVGCWRGCYASMPTTTSTIMYRCSGGQTGPQIGHQPRSVKTKKTSQDVMSDLWPMPIQPSAFPDCSVGPSCILFIYHPKREMPARHVLFPLMSTPHSFSSPLDRSLKDRPRLFPRNSRWTTREHPQLKGKRRALRRHASLCLANTVTGPLRALSISNAISALVE